MPHEEAVKTFASRMYTLIRIEDVHVTVHEAMNRITQGILHRSRSMPYNKTYVMKTFRFKLRDALRRECLAMDWEFPIVRDTIRLMIRCHSSALNNTILTVYSIPYLTYTAHNSDICAMVPDNAISLNVSRNKLAYFKHCYEHADTIVSLAQTLYNTLHHNKASESDYQMVYGGKLMSIIY